MSVLKGVVVPSKVKVSVFLYTDANLNKSIEDFQDLFLKQYRVMGVIR